jgi:hypothetical protein
MSAFDIGYIQFRTELPFVEIDEFVQKPILLDFAKCRHMNS